MMKISLTFQDHLFRNRTIRRDAKFPKKHVAHSLGLIAVETETLRTYNNDLKSPAFNVYELLILLPISVLCVSFNLNK